MVCEKYGIPFEFYEDADGGCGTLVFEYKDKHYEIEAPVIANESDKKMFFETLSEWRVKKKLDKLKFDEFADAVLPIEIEKNKKYLKRKSEKG